MDKLDPKYAAERPHICIRYGPQTLTISEAALREAARAAIHNLGASTVLRHDCSERGIETALSEFMKWILVPTLKELK
jgi:hypothetical protein